MIDLETLQRGPDRLTGLPVLSEDEARNEFEATIQKAKKLVTQFAFINYQQNPLFDVTADSEYAGVYSQLGYGGPIGKIQRSVAQESALDTMSKYGFDESSFYHNGLLSHDDDDGTSLDVNVYPSKDIPKLAFMRYLTSDTKTGNPIELNWYVEVDFSINFNILPEAIRRLGRRGRNS